MAKKKTRAQRRAMAKRAKQRALCAPLTAIQLVLQTRTPQSVVDLVSSFADCSVDLELWKACQFNSIPLLDKIWNACTPPTQPSPADKGPGHKAGWQRRQYLRTDRFYGRHQFRLAMLEAVKLPGIDMARWLFSHFKGCVVPNQAVELACALGRLDILQFWYATTRPREVDVRAELQMPPERSVSFERVDLAQFTGADVASNAEIEARATVLERDLAHLYPDLMMLDSDSRTNQELLQYLRDGTEPTDAAANRALDKMFNGKIITVTNDEGELIFLKFDVKALEEAEKEHQPDKHETYWGWNDVTKAVENKHKATYEWLYNKTLVDRDIRLLLQTALRLGDLEFLEFDSESCDNYKLQNFSELTTSAVASGRIEVLEWIYQHGYKRDGDMAMVEACKMGRLDLATWLVSHKYTEAGLAITLAAGEGRLDMARELYRRYWPRIKENRYFPLSRPPERSKEYEGWLTRLDLMVAAINGRLDVVEWLVETFSDEPTVDLFAPLARRGQYSADIPTLKDVAMEGHLSVFKYLLGIGMECPPLDAEVMDRAAANNQLDMVKWLHYNGAEGCTKRAMDFAASGGHLEVVQWLHTNRSEGCTTQAMDRAAENGHLDVVKWLHDNRTEGCTTEAMDRAVQNGHFSVAKWLHENRSEGCTTKAMDCAARNGRLDMVQWLHSHRTEGCTTEAMDGAAREGHLGIVRWLHENRKEGCTVGAMDGAARGGHRDVVYWLYENRSEGCSSDAMDNAAMCGDFELVLFFHSEFEGGCTERAFDMPDEKNKFPRSSGMRPYDVYQWLDEYYPPDTAP